MSVPADEMAGALDALGEGIQAAAPDQEQAKLLEQEQNAVKVSWTEYDDARKFDKWARRQYAVDRRYAAGTADQTWAVNTNLIGSFIDILTSFLYARNPDLSVRKSPKVDARGTKEDEDFARTMELIVSQLWKRGRLKAACKKQVRSALSVGAGWLKVVLICDGKNLPQMQANLKDARDNFAKLEALKRDHDYSTGAPEEADAKIQQQNELIASIEQSIEVTVRKSLAIDFVSAENMQVSLDVNCTEDYAEADWTANAIYRPKTALKELFPRLSADDCKSAKCYYQRQTQDMQPLTDQIHMGAYGGVNPDEAEQYTSGDQASTPGESGPEFVKIVEKWDRRTNHVHTMVEGVKRWAKEPYQPDYPSTRFYPYFGLQFFPVDGSRHGQSLSWRLHKLQDEYARSRSNFRLTRERSIPGVLFNAGQIDPETVKKIVAGTQQEYIPFDPVDKTTPIQNLFAPKPIPAIDQRLFDNTPILQDMEKVAGVQEALQSSVSTNKTATEAEIQQTGFASRTTADRDTLEDMLTDLANYTGEITLSAFSVMDAQRIAGSAAFWPEGMDIEDILTLLQIEIEAGTTGKPKAQGDRDAWAVLLPQIKELIVQIESALLAGNQPGAQALIELLRETMIRMGDDTDIERFIPQVPAGAGAPPVAGPAVGPAPPLSDASLQPPGQTAPGAVPQNDSQPVV